VRWSLEQAYGAYPQVEEEFAADDMMLGDCLWRADRGPRYPWSPGNRAHQDHMPGFPDGKLAQ